MIAWSVIIFIVILGVLVIVHELGHFILAKLFGVGVDEFGVGFPPRLAAVRKGSTVYSLNWIPVGGFVKIKGVVGGDQAHTSTAPDDFSHRPMWQRFLILFAGIGMNCLLTVVLFTIGFVSGMPSTLEDVPAQATVTERQVVVVDFQADAPAKNEGVQVGDVITAIDGSPIATVADVKRAIAQHTSSDPLTIAVQRSSTATIELRVTPVQLQGTTTYGIGAFFVESGTVHLPVFSALLYSTKKTGLLILSLFSAVGGIVRDLFTTGQLSANVSGPIGIASLTYQATQLGWIYVIQFAAVLSLNLAIFNLFPFPALDGGRIVFLLVELIWRRPLNQRVEAVIHNLGFVILLLLIMAITVKDALRLF